MDWLEAAREKAKRKNQILFSPDSPLLQGLSTLVGTQNRRVLVLWALESAEETVETLEQRYPGEDRPRQALEAAWLWAAGTIKMPLARRAILDCHALAKEFSAPADMARCHAVGQACSVVHTPGHALGYPIYDLTALARELGLDRCRDALEARAEHYVDRLLYWQAQPEDQGRSWAVFLRR